MGLGDKLIARVEQQAETLAEYRQLDDRRRSRITDLERKLGDAQGERDKLAAEIETLKGAMAADDQRLRDAEERVWLGGTWGCDAPEKMADEILYLRKHRANSQQETADLRQQLDAAQAALTRERLEAEERGREMERLRAFVELARGITPRNGYAGVEMLRAALTKLDAGTTEPTPVAETLDAEGAK